MTTTTPSRRHALRPRRRRHPRSRCLPSRPPPLPPPPPPKTSYRPGRYPATPVLDAPARHLANRFSYGVTPKLAAEVRAAGGHLAWFDKQLATAYDGSADNLC